MVAGTAYLVHSATVIIAPEFRRSLFRILIPFYLGEVPIIFWLMIRGAAVPEAAPAPWM